MQQTWRRVTERKNDKTLIYNVLITESWQFSTPDHCYFFLQNDTINNFIVVSWPHRWAEQMRHCFSPVAWLTDGTVYHKVSSTPTLWTPSETDRRVSEIWDWAFYGLAGPNWPHLLSTAGAWGATTHMTTVHSNYCTLMRLVSGLWSFVMAALRSRCRHYIFALWFLSSIFFLFLA